MNQAIQVLLVEDEEPTTFIIKDRFIYHHDYAAQPHLLRIQSGSLI